MINYDKLQIFYGWCVDLSVVKEDFYKFYNYLQKLASLRHQPFSYLLEYIPLFFYPNSKKKKKNYKQIIPPQQIRKWLVSCPIWYCSSKDSHCLKMMYRYVYNGNFSVRDLLKTLHVCSSKVGLSPLNFFKRFYDYFSLCSIIMT